MFDFVDFEIKTTTVLFYIVNIQTVIYNSSSANNNDEYKYPNQNYLVYNSTHVNMHNIYIVYKILKTNGLRIYINPFSL